MKYLQIQIKDDGIMFMGWHNYPTRYNIEYMTEEQLQALIKRVVMDLFPFIQGRHPGCQLRFRIVNLKSKQKVLAQASPIFHSSCEGKLGIALE